MLPEPPYPPDTRCKGWRFVLDHERILQSDTWALASLNQRPWLLMLWLVAWQQTPTGSLPDDHMLIAARIGLPLKEFAEQKALLLRGWVLHSDQRLYHATITENVLEMIERRNAEADRKAAYRLRQKEKVPDLSRGTGSGQATDSDGSDDTRTRTRTRTRTSKQESPPSLIEKELSKLSKKPLTLDDFLANCKSSGKKPIGDDDPIFDYADKTGVSEEMLYACWQEFKLRYIGNAKRYADWPAVFRNAVRSNWYRLWFLKDGEQAAWTTAGEQARRVAA